MSLFGLVDLARGPGERLLRLTMAMGFSEAVARRGLRAELDAWLMEGATDDVLTELAGIDETRAPSKVLVVGASTLPVSTMRAVLMARLLGAQVLLKPPTGFEGLASVLAEADGSVIPTCFPSGDEAALTRALDEVDSVVVLGEDETCAALAQRARAHQSFVGYGHRISGAHLVDPEPSDYAGLATDVLAWDGHGCLSPRIVWTAHDPMETARQLAGAIATMEGALPYAPGPEIAHARHVARIRGVIEAQVVQTETSILIVGSPLGPSPGGRVVRVLSDDDAPWETWGETLSTLGRSARSTASPSLPSVRVCALGQMQRPPLTWPHDGRPNLLPMLKPVA